LTAKLYDQKRRWNQILAVRQSVGPLLHLEYSGLPGRHDSIRRGRHPRVGCVAQKC